MNPILISRSGRRSLVKIFAVIVYVGVATALLVEMMNRVGTTYDNEAYMLFSLKMIAMGFPCSLVAAVLNAICAAIFSSLAGHGYGPIVFTWLLMLTFGFIQWFVILPWLFDKWRSRRSTQNDADRR